MHQLTASTLATLASLTLLPACSGGGTLPASEPFRIQGLQVEPTQDEARLTWRTTEPATAVVHWGLPDDPTPQELVVLEEAEHQEVVLHGLTPDTEYELAVTATSRSGREATSDVLTFLTPPPPAFAPDDFDAANLDTERWTLVDPTGAGEIRLTGTGTADAHLVLEVPAGVESLPWTGGNDALRVVQAAPEGDWGLEAAFAGPLSTSGTGHGVVVEVDEDTFLRFDFAFNSDKVQAFAAILDDGQVLDTFADVVQSGPWPDGEPLLMRVERSGVGWTQDWSVDGSTWYQGASFTFLGEPTAVGLHAVTAGTGHGGHVARVDYLLDASASKSNEDVEPAEDVDAPLLYRATASPVGDDAVELRWWTDEPASATVRHGQDTSYAGETVQVADALYEHALLVEGLAPDTTHHFQLVGRDALGHETISPDLTATTLPAGSSGLPEIALWYGSQDADGAWRARFGQMGNPQHQVNLLGNVSDDDEVRLVESVSLYYQLNGGSWNGLAIGDDPEYSYAPWRLAHEGDFNIELEIWELTQVPLVDGVHTNEVLIEALDDDGNATYQEVVVEYTPGVTWELDTTVDWNEVQALEDVVQVVDGHWYVDDHPSLGPGLRLRTGALGYDRLVAVGEGDGADAWEDFEVTVTGTVLGFDDQGWTEGTQSYAMGLALRWSGHNPGWGYSQPNHDIYPFGGIFVYRWFETFERWELWINHDETVVPFDAPISVGETWVFKARCETQAGGGTRYRLKRWRQDEAEPGSWDFEYTTPATEDHPRGSVLLVSHHVDVLFGDVTVTGL